MSGIDFTRDQRSWHKQIGRWSNWSKAVLRRQGALDRACVACVTEFLPRERAGMVVNPEDRKARVSALVPDGSALLAPDPDAERDSLILFNPNGTEQRPYGMVAKPSRKEPTPGIVCFWTLQVRQ